MIKQYKSFAARLRARRAERLAKRGIVIEEPAVEAKEEVVSEPVIEAAPEVIEEVTVVEPAHVEVELVAELTVDSAIEPVTEPEVETVPEVVINEPAAESAPKKKSKKSK